MKGFCEINGVVVVDVNYDNDNASVSFQGFGH